MSEFEWSVNKLNIINCKTWTNGYQSSRIDRFYTQKYLVKNCKYIEILQTSVSDHKLVFCETALNNCVNKRAKLNIWKLNECLLDHVYVQNRVIELCKEIPYYLNNSKCVHWYDKFITKITNYVKHESRILNKKKKEIVNSFFKQLKDLDVIFDQGKKKKI